MESWASFRFFGINDYPFEKLDGIKFENKQLKIIGSCGRDYPYLDFMGNTINIDDPANQKLYAQLTKIN